VFDVGARPVVPHTPLWHVVVRVYVARALDVLYLARAQGHREPLRVLRAVGVQVVLFGNGDPHKGGGLLYKTQPVAQRDLFEKPHLLAVAKVKGTDTVAKVRFHRAHHVRCHMRKVRVADKEEGAQIATLLRVEAYRSVQNRVPRARVLVTFIHPRSVPVRVVHARERVVKVDRIIRMVIQDAVAERFAFFGLARLIEPPKVLAAAIRQDLFQYDNAFLPAAHVHLRHECAELLLYRRLISQQLDALQLRNNALGYGNAPKHLLCGGV